jgi:hypothetical protein
LYLCAPNVITALAFSHSKVTHSELLSNLSVCTHLLLISELCHSMCQKIWYETEFLAFRVQLPLRATTTTAEIIHLHLVWSAPFLDVDDRILKFPRDVVT